MRIVTLCVALAFVPAALRAQDVRIGPTIGFLFLEHRDTSLTHGPLVDEITVGRTFLAGVTVDLLFTTHDCLVFEVAIGPYHNDVERSCINWIGPTPSPPCTPEPFKSVSRGILYGMQYVRTFGTSRWRALVGGGLGVKTYAYRESFAEPENASPTYTVTFGAEGRYRFPFRVELRTVIVQDNPLLLGKTRVELQARATWLFQVTK